LLKDTDLQVESRNFLSAFKEAVQNDNFTDISTAPWAGMRDFLESLSRTRVQQGFSPTETATFVFSFKQPLFDRLRHEYGRDAEGLANDLWRRQRCSISLTLYHRNPSEES
jgi:rsbT co-antagonist protein RsbR